VVRVSNLDELFWPSLGLTKRWLIGYYLECAAALLPHLRGHPLTLYRCPDGVEGPGRFQTRAAAHPGWVRTTTMYFPRSGKTFEACVIDDAATLV
jgi:bifunctional non-homologous end joining protein LigD